MYDIKLNTFSDTIILLLTEITLWYTIKDTGRQKKLLLQVK